MTLRKRGGTLVIGALTLARLAGVLPPAAERPATATSSARDRVRRRLLRRPFPPLRISWGGRHPYYRHGNRWRGYYGSPYHRYHRFGWGG